MARIVVVSGIQLSANPRVVKEADALAAAGHEVEVIGATLEQRLGGQDRQLLAGKPWKYTVLVDASATGLRHRLKFFGARARLRLWREAHARLAISNPRQLGIAVHETLRHCLRRDADLYIVHNPQGLWVGVELLKRNRTVAVDIEDWYSENLRPADRRGYPVDALRRWEATLLRGAVYSSTTSKRLSEALAGAYDCSPPAVLYNAFPWREREAIDGKVLDRENRTLLSMCWFSQVIGPDRGLETLMDALAEVQIPCEIHLRGNCRADFREMLVSRAPAEWRPRIHFHREVPHAELISRISEHDVGLAAEIPYCRNIRFTVSNKILQYLLAGLPVLASDTDGQREVAEIARGAVTTFAAGNPSDLAAALNRLLAARGELCAARVHALAAAERFFCWERSAPALLDCVEAALAGHNAQGARRSDPNYHSLK